jgi:hypothetical protein
VKKEKHSAAANFWKRVESGPLLAAIAQRPGTGQDLPHREIRVELPLQQA